MNAKNQREGMGSNARSPPGNLDIVVTKSDGWFVAEDAETGVASQGKTKVEALENLAEALRLHNEPLPDGEPEPSDAPWL